MISDSESRAVAARMRELLERDRNGITWRIRATTALAIAMTDCLPYDYEFGPTLADLVDRPTCRNLSFKPADELICSACGERVDIAYLDSADDYHASYCPSCGAEVVEGE